MIIVFCRLTLGSHYPVRCRLKPALPLPVCIIGLANHPHPYRKWTISDPLTLPFYKFVIKFYNAAGFLKFSIIHFQKHVPLSPLIAFFIIESNSDSFDANNWRTRNSFQGYIQEKNRWCCLVFA